jgi:hypothetical protein
MLSTAYVPRVHLVGSIPLENPDPAFRAAATLDSSLARIPDGGDRRTLRAPSPIPSWPPFPAPISHRMGRRIGVRHDRGLEVGS